MKSSLQYRVPLPFWFRRFLEEIGSSKFRIFTLAGVGILIGIVFLHPFSMLVFGYTHEAVKETGVSAVAHSFKLEMWPMWIWYGSLGAVLGSALGFLLNRITLLEGIVPICAWCGRIRTQDGDGEEPAVWERLDKYLQKRGVKETHGICPECRDKVRQRIAQAQKSGRDEPS